VARVASRQVARWASGVDASGFGTKEDRLRRYRRRRDRREDRELRESRREPPATALLGLLRFLVAAALSVGLFLGGAFLILQNDWTWGWPVLLILVALIMMTLGGVRPRTNHQLSPAERRERDRRRRRRERRRRQRARNR